MPATLVKPQFLRPKSRQFPVDEVVENIVSALEKRHWKVDGIEVKFHDFGTGQEKFRRVDTIEGENFRLWFCRVQGKINQEWNDASAVTELNIPLKELHIYDDESGPTLFLYVGNNWEKDKNKFVHGPKVNSKLYKKPKTYLLYKGECRCMSTSLDLWNRLPHTHLGSRPPLLAHDNDLNREYESEGDEPKEFLTSKIMEEFRVWLDENVLKPLVSLPLPDGPLVEEVEEEIPFPDSIGPLFTFGDWRDLERITAGKKNPEALKASQRYGMLGSGKRLTALSDGDRQTPQIAYEGFLWCGITALQQDVDYEDLVIPGFYRWDNNVLIQLLPKKANDIYIADYGPAEGFRKDCFEVVTKLTDEQLATYLCMPGKTIIPIHEYKGDFSLPVVLVNRELDFSEVEILKVLPRS